MHQVPYRPANATLLAMITPSAIAVMTPTLTAVRPVTALRTIAPPVISPRTIFVAPIVCVTPLARCVTIYATAGNCLSKTVTRDDSAVAWSNKSGGGLTDSDPNYGDGGGCGGFDNVEHVSGSLLAVRCGRR